ncbi:hypothetical protein MPC4_10344 [Methylocella tundrae]|uniref:Uncharacterized protein n=1 Tax=Methylocella tundrae TaxID=227605 RepID=A0A8B6M0Y5_METTU|nr:hypothetical protein MPC1_3220004 [Methylocella tundrae]VTZ48394.1 hypothetical protein MPC4_10344 [Methylocella tundrae]
MATYRAPLYTGRASETRGVVDLEFIRFSLAMKPRSRISRRQLKAQHREFIRRINYWVGPGTIYGGIPWMVESQQYRKTRQIRTINEARARNLSSREASIFDRRE